MVDGTVGVADAVLVEDVAVDGTVGVADTVVVNAFTVWRVAGADASSTELAGGWAISLGLTIAG